MPSLLPPSLTAHRRLSQLAQAVLLGLGSVLVLSACGSDSPTVRNTPAETQKPEATYKLTVRSAVKVKNATVRLIKAANGEELGKKTLTDGSEISFDVKASSANSSLLIAEISGQNNSSEYFDPVLNRFAPFGNTMHVAFAMFNADTFIYVSPYTEIAYQRALVRSNSIDKDKPANNSLSVDSVAAANREVHTAFRVNPTTLLPPVESIENLQKFLIDTKDVKNPPNTTAQYLNIFYGLGHINAEHLKNTNDQTPLLTFTRQASMDMRDGSFDGMGLAGDGEAGTVFLADPLVSPQVVNTDPNLTVAEDFQKVQDATRKNYAERLKTATLDFLQNTVKSTDKTGIEYFTSVDYLTGTHPTYNENLPSIPVPHSIGAGNYKYAFGLRKIRRIQTQQQTLDGNCNKLIVPANPNAGKEGTPEQYDETGCQFGIKADNSSGAYNLIENLVGTYSTPNQSCKLNIYLDGTFTLASSSQSYSGKISGKESDALIRLEAGTEKYLLNVASAERNPPQFIQIRVTNQNVVSAIAGTVNDIRNNPFPRVLDRQELVCEGFNPVFNKP